MKIKSLKTPKVSLEFFYTINRSSASFGKGSFGGEIFFCKRESISPERYISSVFIIEDPVFTRIFFPRIWIDSISIFFCAFSK